MYNRLSIAGSDIPSQLSFEDVVLKGLASDGGLFILEDIPVLPVCWQSDWYNLTFQELAFRIFLLYISPSEVPTEDLKEIVRKVVFNLSSS